MLLLSSFSVGRITVAKERLALHLLALLLTWQCFCAPAAADGAKSAAENKVKAAFLYHFTRFVQWPDSAFFNAQTPITIGVLADGKIAEAAEETISGQIVRNRKVVVRRFKSVRDITECHVLFIGSSHDAQMSKALDAVKGSSALVVGEASRFIDRGGVIGFIVDSERVKFEVNLKAAKKQRLEISSKLLDLAQNVIK